MPDLAALTAFGQTEPRRHRSGPLVLVENVSLGLASLAVARNAAAPRLGELQLPGPGVWMEGADLSAFWTGPRQWMIEVQNGADRDFERELKTAVPGAAVTGQTDGWVVLEITAEDAHALDRLLEKLVNLDPTRYGPGSATRTGLEHMSVFVVRRSPTAVAVLGMRSMAASLWHALESAIDRVASGRA